MPAVDDDADARACSATCASERRSCILRGHASRLYRSRVQAHRQPRPPLDSRNVVQLARTRPWTLRPPNVLALAGSPSPHVHASISRGFLHLWISPVRHDRQSRMRQPPYRGAASANLTAHHSRLYISARLHILPPRTGASVHYTTYLSRSASSTSFAWKFS